MKTFLISVTFFIVLFLSIGATKYTLLTIPPSKSLKNGFTAIIKKDNLGFIESPDSICLKREGVSDSYCKFIVLSEILKDNNIVFYFPYFKFIYNLSLLGLDKKNIDKKRNATIVQQNALNLLMKAQEIKIALMMAKLNHDYVYSLSDFVNGEFKKKYMNKLPTYKGVTFNYGLGIISVGKKVKMDTCVALKKMGGAIIYNNNKIENYSYGCLISEYKPIFFMSSTD